jgi:hypothetical protein
LGTISGLPNNFTINGAAVNEKNQVLVSSAMESNSYFVVDPKTWAASEFKVIGKVWHSSDLANSNILVSGNKPSGTAPDMLSKTIIGTGSSAIQIYPNPVTNNRFVIQFNQLEKGNYTIQVTDATGRQLVQQEVNVTGENQSQAINLNRTTTKGIYMVKVLDVNSKIVSTSKLVVQ